MTLPENRVASFDGAQCARSVGSTVIYTYIITAAVVLFGAFLFVVPQHVTAQSTNCHLYKAGDASPSGFGVAWNPYSSVKNLLLTTTCTTGAAELSAGTGNENHYVYKGGFTFVNGVWSAITFAGNFVQGSNAWLKGQGTFVYQNPPPNTPVHWVAYICVWQSNGWKCGCKNSACSVSSWQLQAFRAVPPSPPGNPGTTGGGTTGNTTGSQAPDRSMQTVPNNAPITIPLSTNFNKFSVTASDFAGQYNLYKGSSNVITHQQAQNIISGSLSSLFTPSAYGSSLTFSYNGQLQLSFRDSANKRWTMTLTENTEGSNGGRRLNIVWPTSSDFRGQSESVKAYLEVFIREHFQIPGPSFNPFKTNLNEFR